MYAEDMSICWNQSKGQYEANGYNYYQNDNSFTRTADQRLKYKESTSFTCEENDEDDKKESSVNLGSWLGTFMLLLLPGINIISIIVMAVSSKSETKKTFARAILLFSLILITLALIFMVFTCDKIDYKQIFDSVLALFNKMLGVIKRII